MINHFQVTITCEYFDIPTPEEAAQTLIDSICDDQIEWIVDVIDEHGREYEITVQSPNKNST